MSPCIRGSISPFVMALAFGLALAAPPANAQSESGARGLVRPGVEVLVNHYASELAGKRVGILTNATGVDRELRSTVDLVRALPKVQVVRLFSPEHGLRGAAGAGEAVDSGRDPVSGLLVVSLYGDHKKPRPADLAGIDVVLYDIQDVGHRTYTYVSTLTNMAEACAEAGVALWVLDRPDPLGGDKVGGPMLDDALRSFIGVHNVPQVYGLTPGEWARLIAAERVTRLKLRVVPMQGWRRGMLYGELGWPWVPPSPHVPHWETAFFYAMTGTLGERQVVSEGVGTPQPFELVGAPWLDAAALAAALERERLAGVRFRAVDFTPRYGPFQGQACHGVQIHLADARACQPARVSLTLLATLARLAPERRLFAPQKTDPYGMFMKALGSAALGRALAAGRPLEELRPLADAGAADYLARRKKALIYE